jgi:alkanesulfonate monooxygenase SsuD/methylene tetrahydromethanopterin reductase-like flavin-dependent oxidoreductase (luciferase family)
MDVAIGLPATIPGVKPDEVTDWAREAERNGFSSLSVIDRLVYSNYEPLLALMAAAAVTERIKLATTVLLAPLRLDTALFAKQAATLDNFSEGRLVLGMAVGGREDDFEVSGASFKTRGRRFEEQLDEMKRIWSGEGDAAIGPPPAREGGPTLIIGGYVETSFRRAARYGDGWAFGGGPPDQFAESGAKVDEIWAQEGRRGKPHKMALAYFALGPDAERNADRYLHHYYAWLGETADMIAGSAATSEETVQQRVEAFERSGCDELVLFPCSTDVEQVELLAGAVGARQRSAA